MADIVFQLCAQFFGWLAGKVISGISGAAYWTAMRIFRLPDAAFPIAVFAGLALVVSTIVGIAVLAGRLLD